MSINDPTKLNINETGTQPTLTDGATSAQQQAPKNIWAGMTRADAEQYNLLDEFNRANANSDEVLTENEYNAHIKGQEDTQNNNITSISEKRKAIGGIYTVVQGDTLGKIAEDFGIDVYALHRANMSTIGTNINKLKIGQQIKITSQKESNEEKMQAGFAKAAEFWNNLSDETKNIIANTLGKPELAHAKADDILSIAMELSVGDILKCYQKVIENCDKEKIGAFLKNMTGNDEKTTEIISKILTNTDSPEEINAILAIVNTNLGQNVLEMSLADLIKKMQEMSIEKANKLTYDLYFNYADQENTLPDALRTKGCVTTEDYYTYYNIPKDIENLEEDARCEVVGKAIADKVKKDLNEKDETSLYNQNIKDISENKHLTQKEQENLKNKGKDINNLTKEDIEDLAKERVKRAHYNYIVESMRYCDSVGKSSDMIHRLKDYLNKDVQDVINDKKDKGTEVGLLSSRFLERAELSVHEAKELANIIVKNHEALGSKLMSNKQFKDFTKPVLENADENLINEFIQSNTERAEIFQSVIKEILSETTDSTRANVLHNALQTTNTIIAENTAGGSISSSNSSAQSQQTSSLNNIQSVLQFYQTQDNITNPITSTREASAKFYQDRGITDISAQQQKTNMSARQIFNEMSLPEQVRYVKSRLENMQKSQVYEMIANNFVAVPDKFRPFVDNYFRQMPKQTLVTITIEGSEKVREFMFAQSYVQTADLVDYVKKFPGSFERLPDGLRDQIKEYIEDNIKGVINPEKKYGSEIELLNK